MDKSFTQNHHEPYSTKQVTARDLGAIISIFKDILLILLYFHYLYLRQYIVKQFSPSWIVKTTLELPEGV